MYVCIMNRSRPFIVVRGKTKALRSELLSVLSSQVSSQNEFSRVGTSSEKDQKTRSDPNFRKTAISETREKTQIFVIFFASLEMFGKHGNYRKISEIRKTAISETRENENFGKNCLTQGLRKNPLTKLFSVKLNRHFHCFT